MFYYYYYAHYLPINVRNVPMKIVCTGSKKRMFEKNMHCGQSENLKPLLVIGPTTPIVIQFQLSN